jgi:8-oxo-dGTP pyrophosphatase MutT (NUDIX family)
MDAAGRVLLQQRDDDLPPAGYGRWTIPGGRREGAEPPRATALREFEEETGVRLERLRFFTVASAERYPALTTRSLHVFFADDEVPRERIAVYEGLDFQYWSPAEVESLLMNDVPRDILRAFFASDLYRGTLAVKAPYRRGASVLVLDPWGRVLLQLRDDDLPPERWPGQWSLPGGLIEPGESPDAAALREFEEETGQLLEEVRLFRVFRRDRDLPTDLVHVQHVYYADPAIEESEFAVNEGQAFRYFAPGETAALTIPVHARAILDAFFESPAYRALFH